MPDATTYYNIRSQISRAVVALLVQEGAGTSANVLPMNYLAAKTLPNTVVHPGIAKEVEEGTGTYSIPILVKIRGSTSESVGATAAEIARPFFDERSAKTLGILRRSDDGASLQYTADAITAAGRALKTSTNLKIAAANPDMDQFSCLYWKFSGFGDGQPDAESSVFEEILMFEATCCSSDQM